MKLLRSKNNLTAGGFIIETYDYELDNHDLQPLFSQIAQPNTFNIIAVIRSR